MTKHDGNIKRRLVGAIATVETGRSADIHRALRLAIPRVFSEAVGLSVSLGKSGQKRINVDQFSSKFAGLMLLASLNSEAEKAGFVGADYPVVLAAVQMQTLGQVMTIVPNERSATLGEAALIAPLFDLVLERTFKELPETFAQFAFKRTIESVQAMSLLAGNIEFELHEFLINFDATQSGRMVFAFPIPETQPVESAKPSIPDEVVQYQMNLPVELNAVIYNSQRAWGDLSQWKVGHELILGPEVLFNIAVQSLGGKTEFHAQLGQRDGRRALRLYLDEEAVPSSLPEPPARELVISEAAETQDASGTIIIDEDLRDWDLEDLEF